MINFSRKRLRLNFRHKKTEKNLFLSVRLGCHRALLCCGIYVRYISLMSVFVFSLVWKSEYEFTFTP